jgi:hypothetical protein
MVPWNTPFSAISRMRASSVASTRPSTTSVSQSLISTPFSLMSGPTTSLDLALVDFLSVSVEGRGWRVGGVTGAGAIG